MNKLPQNNGIIRDKVNDSQGMIKKGSQIFIIIFLVDIFGRYFHSGYSYNYLRSARFVHDIYVSALTSLCVTIVMLLYFKIRAKLKSNK